MQRRNLGITGRRLRDHLVPRACEIPIGAMMTRQAKKIEGRADFVHRKLDAAAPVALRSVLWSIVTRVLIHLFTQPVGAQVQVIGISAEK